MGKTIRFDAKYPNELTKDKKTKDKKTRPVEKGRRDKVSKKSKRYLKDKFLQRTWPIPSEDPNKKGQKV